MVVTSFLTSTPLTQRQILLGKRTLEYESIQGTQALEPGPSGFVPWRAVYEALEDKALRLKDHTVRGVACRTRCQTALAGSLLGPPLFVMNSSHSLQPAPPSVSPASFDLPSLTLNQATPPAVSPDVTSHL